MKDIDIKFLSDTATIAGDVLSYVYTENRANHLPTLVFLHEGLGSISLWGSFLENVAVATGAPVVAYSRAGYGGSGAKTGEYQPDYMHREALDVLPAFLDHLGIKRPILFGHSDGASIALIYASTHARSLSGLIIEAPHVFVEEVSIQSIAKIGAAAKDTDLIQKLGRHHDNPDMVFWRWNGIWLNPAFRDWRITDGLAGITCPMLLIQGEDDEYGTLAQLDSIVAAVPGPVETLILPDCGHSPHRDQRNAVITATQRFLDRVGSD